jgi:serine/threonine-protein kinase RsbW
MRTVQTQPEFHTNGHPSGQIVRLTIPAKPEYITLGRLALTGLARLRPVGAELLADLKLALTEAASNSVRHAYNDTAGHVQITYALDGDRLAIEVVDEGTGFGPPSERIEDELGELSEGGLGIAIINAIADELEFGTGPDGRGSRLRFVKLLSE